MNDYPHLFSRGRLGSLETPNRIVMAPMVRNYGTSQGHVTDKYLAHISRIAPGGVGTMILDACYVSMEGRGFHNQLGLHDDSTIEGMSKVVKIAHDHGVVVGPQLYHAGRQTSSKVLGRKPVAPSPIADPMMKEEPEELSVGEIKRIVSAFGDAARRARQAGFDFVEIHGAHGYLITQFLSPFTNKRSDEYGGSFENRLRFLEEIVSAVHDAVGAGFTVLVRLSADEMVDGGITLDHTLKIAMRLDELGIHALDISAGSYASFNKGMMIAPMAMHDGLLLDFARSVKQSVKIPVITVGKLRDPKMCEQALQDGVADFIALGRMFLSDPDWPNKVRLGMLDEINTCIACNQGCIGRLFEQQDCWCTVNPETAREMQFAEPPMEEKKRLLIVGGGPAGMQAAITGAKHGHSVTLCEAEDHLGGQLIAAAAAPFRPGWEELRQYMMHQINRLNVDVRLNTKVTTELVQKENPDVVILATGATPKRPTIPGIERSNVVAARDLLEGRAEAKGKVIVAGGGCAGAQTAEFLADRGHDVTIIELLEYLAVDAAPAEGTLLIERLHQRGVKIMLDTLLESIEEGEIEVEVSGEKKRIPCDTVVLCLGAESDPELIGRFREVNPNTLIIGDAVRPRKVTDALAEGSLAILRLRQVLEHIGAPEQVAAWAVE